MPKHFVTIFTVGSLSLVDRAAHVQQLNLVEPMSSEPAERRLRIHVDGCDARSAQLRGCWAASGVDRPDERDPRRDF